MTDDSVAPPPTTDDTSRGPRLGQAGRFRVLDVSITDLEGGQAICAFDQDLERRVALLRVDSESGHSSLQRQAQAAHPSIRPIHGIERAADGSMMAVVEPISGRSLQAAIQSPRGTTTVQQWLLVIRKVCEAASCAHDRGFVHASICPDHIIMAPHGAVYLIGWNQSVARSGDATAVSSCARTVYTAPEIADGGLASPLSDLYSIGVTMLHLFTGQMPTADSGKAPAVNARFYRHVPPALMAIVRCAMSSSPAGRYRSVQALIRDIDAFLSSQPVSVMPLHSLPNRCGALIRRHVLTLCAIAIAAGSLWLWAGERMSQFASWGKPELVINATTSHPASLVRITSGAFKEVPGGIVSAGAEENIAFFPQRLDGPIAIEYEAFMQVDQPPCDVSVIYATRDPFLADTTPARYMIQVGALDNTCAQILDPELRRVAYKPLHLIPGQRHRVRVEIDEESILIMVDGEDVCEHRTIVPFTGGWVGLYGFYPGKMFANIALFKKGIPARIASMTIGDQFCRDGQWERAAGFYEQLAKDHAGTSIADEAAYRCGIAWTRAGDLESAQRMWKKVGHGHWRGRTQVHEIEEMLEGRIPVPGSPPLQLNRDASLPSRNQTLAEAVVHRITAAYPDANRDLRSRLEATWNSAVLRMGGPDLADKRAITALLEARNSLFPERCNHMAAAAQHAMRDFAGVALRHPEHAAIAADALFRLGKHEEVLERYRDFRFQVGTALMAMGRFDELRSMQPPMPYLVSLADTTYGFDAASFDPVAAQAAIKAGSEGPMTLLRFAQLLDLPDEAMALCRNNVYPPSDTVLTVHLQAGQEDLLLRTYPNWLGARIAATCHQQLRYFTAGQPVKRLDLPQDEGWFSDRLDWIPRLLVKPFVDHISGDPQAMQQALDAIANQHRWHFAQQPWFCGELLSGRIDADAFARQPCHVGVTTLADLCLGMKAELDGSRQTAREAYTRLLSRPPHLRTIHGPNRDPTAEQFARWRLKALEAIR